MTSRVARSAGVALICWTRSMPLVSPRLWSTMATSNGSPACGASRQRLDRRRRVGDGGRAHAPSGGVGLEDPPVGGVVVDDQDARPVEVDADVRVTGRLAAHHDRDREVEPAALALHALDADLAAHQPHELAGDGQPEAGAAEPSGGAGVGLCEGFEQPLEVLGRRSRCRCRAPRSTAASDRRADSSGSQAETWTSTVALGGELDGVGQEVSEHLRDAQPVGAHEPRHVVADVAVQRDPLVLASTVATIWHVFSTAS